MHTDRVTFHCRDFPVASKFGPSARKFLDDLGGLIFSNVHMYRLAEKRPTLCKSGGPEEYLEERNQDPFLRRGGQHRWKNNVPPEGYISIQEAAVALSRSRTGLYYLMQLGELESEKVEGRRYIRFDCCSSHEIGLNLYPEEWWKVSGTMTPA